MSDFREEQERAMRDLHPHSVKQWVIPKRDIPLTPPGPLTRKGRATLAIESQQIEAAQSCEQAATVHAAAEALWRKVAADTQAALREALNAIPAAVDLDAFALLQRVKHVVIGESEAYYFDDTPIILVHPLEVADGIATRTVERLI